MNDKNYKVVWKVFFYPYKQIHTRKNLNKKKAKKLANELNKNSDIYEIAVIKLQK